MHGLSQEEFLSGISGFLGSYYLVLAMMNAVAALYLSYSGRSVVYFRLFKLVPVSTAGIWLVPALLYMAISPLAFTGNPEWMGWISVPESVRSTVNVATNAVFFCVGTLVSLTILFLFRKFFVKPVVAWAGLNLTLVLMGFSMVDADFSAIVTKPDNVPIVGLIFLLGFFTWLATYKAVQNDERFKQGLEPLEKLDNEKVLVWPDLVYAELICMVAVTALLIFWGMALLAPLEEPGSSVKTPNPSKAPWYFLGLQEMLVYYDPWMAGVVAPSLIVVGLMAIPYMDFNKQGNGYYTIDQRKFAYLVFQFGFFVLWVMLIVMGTFLRGPNWNIFGPYEFWDAHKVLALNNVDLSQYFWVSLLGQRLPTAPDGSSGFVEFAYILLRESPGIISVLVYFLVLPPLMALAFFKKFFVRMGFIRYMVMTNLLLFMASLPIKMVLRWTVNMKYIISIPEYFLNF